MSKRKDIRQTKSETSAPAEFIGPVKPETEALRVMPKLESEVMPDSSALGSPAIEMTEPALGANAPAQSNRFPLLAACVAAAAAVGAITGSVGALSLSQALTPSTQSADTTRGLQQALTQMNAEIAALKTSSEASNRQANTQFSKIAERFDRTDRALNEPGSKLASISDSLTRVEKRITSPAPATDVTGSVTDNRSAPAQTKEPPKPSILEGWIIRDIYRGRALVEGRNGLFEIAPGSNLPGVGRVETITQQNGRWVVVTPKGLILSMR